MLLFVIILLFIYYYYNNMNEKKISLNENKNENYKKDDNNNNDLNEYTNLQCLRIPINSYKTVFLYYKKYPKPSIKYPKDLTCIIFYFDSDIDDKFFYLYMSLYGQIDTVDLGSFFNRKGSKNKRRLVYFAIVKYCENESLKKLLKDNYDSQKIINDYINMTRYNNNNNLDYDPLKFEEEEYLGEPDEDGFIEVKANNNGKNHFSNQKGLSFKVAKEEDDFYKDLISKRKKKKENNLYYNFQILDKKRAMYDELKNLFEEDKKALNKKQKLN